MLGSPRLTLTGRVIGGRHVQSVNITGFSYSALAYLHDFFGPVVLSALWFGVGIISGGMAALTFFLMIGRAHE